MSTLLSAIEEAAFGNKQHTRDLIEENARQKPRAFFDLATTICAAFIVIAVLAGVMRMTEFFITKSFSIPEAHAATLQDAYQANLLLRTSEKITMTPGETTTYRVGFKNTGSSAWKNSGEHFLSIYTMAPKYRSSVFYNASWRLAQQPTVMKDTVVQPGTIGFFEFNLTAPEKVGTYRENFHLAAEDLLWLPGGNFTIEIEVTRNTTPMVTTPVVIPAPTPVATSTPVVAPTRAVTPTAESSADGYAATLLLKSHKQEIFLGPDESVDMILGFKNSGTKSWETSILRQGEVAIATTAPAFQHLSWASASEVTRATDEIKPGTLAFFNFTIQAPQQKGSYRPTFRLVVDGVSVPGGEIDIPVTVTADGAPSAVTAPLPAVQMISEPEIRVGLFNTTSAIMIMANGDYNILQDGAVVQAVSGGQPSKIMFDFDYKTYTVTNPNGTTVYQKPVRFVTINPDGVFTIPSYSHPTGWNPSLNDNQFRRSLEIMQAESTGNLWVVNELPMELYLRGLAETSNYSHAEFQKTLATAARTYAFYHWSRNTKHGGYFHVDATYDQVYRGYGNEIRTPTFTASVEATRGSIVTYGGEIAITPYYSRSDGRTRDWIEVWGGSPKPWLVSVPTPYDAGQTLWGHGVGMSARDALYRARDGALWQDIVTYYYQNTQIVKQWR